MNSGSKDRVIPIALHIAIWNGDIDVIKKNLNDGDSVETRDIHGHRALHFALQCAHPNMRDIVNLLLEYGARVRSKDLNGWRTIHHCIAANDEILLASLLREEGKQLPISIEEKIHQTCDKIMQIPDFQGIIQVDVHSWVPIISHLLPSDKISIWKNGENLRFDITLVGFESMSWKRGNLSFLVLGQEKRLITIDHDAKTYTNWFNNGQMLNEEEIMESVHILMSNKMMSTYVSPDKITFSRKHRWLNKNKDVVEDVGMWKETQVYDMHNFDLIIQVRPIKNPHHQKPRSNNNEMDETNKQLHAILESMKKETSSLIIEPGKDFVVPVQIEEGDTIAWKFTTKSVDIAFGLVFHPDSTVEALSYEEDDNLRHFEEIIPEKRVASHSMEQTGQYKAKVSGVLLFKWDNSYSLWKQKQLNYTIYPVLKDKEMHDVSENSKAKTVSTSSSCVLPGRVTDDIHSVTFKDWFQIDISELPQELKDMKPKQTIQMYKAPEAKEKKKTFSATINVSNDFPLTVQEFFPVVEVLSQTSQHFEKIREFFTSKFPPGFPVRFNIPLLPSISATVCFEKMVLTSTSKEIFEIPSSYTLQVEEAKSVEPSQTMCTLSDHYTST